jgi:nitrilase
MNTLKVALAQISPVWLNKERTLEKIITAIEDAGKQQCELVVFGEGLLPGYPFWVSLTNGAEWNSTVQKELHAHYIRNSI